MKRWFFRIQSVLRVAGRERDGVAEPHVPEGRLALDRDGRAAWFAAQFRAVDPAQLNPPAQPVRREGEHDVLPRNLLGAPDPERTPPGDEPVLQRDLARLAARPAQVQPRERLRHTVVW